ncbi:hypothetical protein V491_02356 [Pseudogymnoascus sp. VKM F-3775]|nr:hypothetical protein V491_02356 [Pseudogymnoascus sp. VKM F-3775]
MGKAEPHKEPQGKQGSEDPGQSTDGKRTYQELSEDERYARVLKAKELLKSITRGEEEGTAENQKKQAENNLFEVADRISGLSLEDQKAQLPDLAEAQAAVDEAILKGFEQNDEDKNDAIGSAKVLAKVSMGRRKHALVELGSVENARCYRIVNNGLVNSTQLSEAPDYDDDLRPKIKISPFEARSIIGVAFKGESESLVKEFSVKDALKPKPPTSSKYDMDKRRDKHPTMYLIGKLDIQKDKRNPNKNDWNLWMLSRSSWEKRISDKDQLRKLSFEKAERQFERYLQSLLLGSRNYIPEQSVVRDPTPGERAFGTEATSPSPEREFETEATSPSPEPERTFDSNVAPDDDEMGEL